MLDLGVLVEPVSNVTRGFLIHWYLIPMAITLVLATISDWISDEDSDMTKKLREMSVPEQIFTVGLMAPIAEELAFRILPHHIGVGSVLLVVLSVVWLLLHGRRVLFLFPIFFVYLKLGLGGAYEMLVVLHIVQNLFSLAIFNAEEYVTNRR